MAALVPLQAFVDAAGPGATTLVRVLRSIDARPDVSAVMIEPGAADGSAAAAFVITTATAGQVHAWAAELEPDPVPTDDPAAEEQTYGWPGAAAPPEAPPVPDGYNVVSLLWR